ncbi:MAG: hypothetical protein Q7S17_00915 [Xanthobacteraceae bacterium]|nr:hypothetical protein [Xanthobacteraceae bacterium]
MFLKFADFAPDAATVETGNSETILNVLPSAVGYRPALAKAAYSGALPAACRGAVSFQTLDGGWRIVAATLDKLYIIDTSTVPIGWTEAGTGYTGPDSDENWSFAPYLGYLYATNVNDGLKRLEIEAGTTFATVAGSPPAARYIGVHGAYLVLGALTGDTSSIAWCDTYAPTNWSTGNADTQTFADGGPVMGICGAAERIIQQRAEQLMIPQPGSSIVFAFKKDVQARGTIAAQSIIQVGSDYAYLAEDGFYFNRQPIGKTKVDKWFFDNADTSRLGTVLGAFDPLNAMFRWAYHTDSVAAFDRQLVYAPNLQPPRWAPITDSVTYFTNIATAGLTLAGVAALYATLDLVPYPFGSRVWQGGRPTFAVFGSDDKLSFYEGSALVATMETGEQGIVPGYRTRINGVRPLIDGDTGAAATARLGTRQRIAGTVDYGSYAALQDSGRVPLRKDGRYHRVGISIPAGSTWTHAKGVEVPDGDVTRLGIR